LSDTELKYPKWERQFQEVVLELNGEKLVAKIKTLGDRDFRSPARIKV